MLARRLLGRGVGGGLVFLLVVADAVFAEFAPAGVEVAVGVDGGDAGEVFEQGEGARAEGEVVAVTEFADKSPVGDKVELGGVFVDVLDTVDEGQDGLLQPGGVLGLDYVDTAEVDFAVGRIVVVVNPYFGDNVPNALRVVWVGVKIFEVVYHN